MKKNKTIIATTCEMLQQVLAERDSRTTIPSTQIIPTKSTRPPARKILLVEQLYRISIQTICTKEPWARRINNVDVELVHSNKHICLLFNGREVHAWPCHETELQFAPLKGGTKYSVIFNRERYRHLYLIPADKPGGPSPLDRIGTRRELGLRYTGNCLSRNQRAIWKEGRPIRKRPTILNAP